MAGFELDKPSLLGADLPNPAEAPEEPSAPKGEPDKPASAPNPEAAKPDDEVRGALLAWSPIPAPELDDGCILLAPMLPNGEIADVLAKPLDEGIFQDGASQNHQ